MKTAMLPGLAWGKFYWTTTALKKREGFSVLLQKIAPQMLEQKHNIYLAKLIWMKGIMNLPAKHFPECRFFSKRMIFGWLKHNIKLQKFTFVKDEGAMLFHC